MESARLVGNVRYAAAAVGSVICACSLLTNLDDLRSTKNEGGSDGGRCDPTAPFQAPVLVAELQDDAGQGEIAARLTADELTLFFTHIGPTEIRTYVAMRSDVSSPFQTPTEVTTVRGAGTLDAYPSITADKLNIFIEEQSDAGDVAIFQAARSNPNAIFSPPTMVSALNTPGYDGQPYVAPDMSELYFTRGATSGGPVSIYSAAWNGLQWGDASLVAGGVNTGAYRSVPVVTADRLTIFFGVRLDDGGGNVDIYQATRPSTSAPFGTAAPVDPLNSGMNDSPDWISTDQCVIYLHSDRSGVLHIYRATR